VTSSVRHLPEENVDQDDDVENEIDNGERPS